MVRGGNVIGPSVEIDTHSGRQGSAANVREVECIVLSPSFEYLLPPEPVVKAHTIGHGLPVDPVPLCVVGVEEMRPRCTRSRVFPEGHPDRCITAYLEPVDIFLCEFIFGITRSNRNTVELYIITGIELAIFLA